MTVYDARTTPLAARVARRAADVDWRRVALVALMLLPLVLGMAARYAVRTVGWVVAWLYAAAVEGWHLAAPRGGD